VKPAPVVEAPVVAEAPAPVVEVAPASALAANGRAPNDPREVRRRKREEERLQKEAELAAAAAPVAEVVEAAPAPVTEEAVVEAVIAEAPRSVQDAVEQHQEAQEKEHEPKPLV
jgi:ribonuclease E